MKAMKGVALTILLGVALLIPSAAQAKLSLYAGQTAIYNRYAGGLTIVESCRHPTQNQVDCTLSKFIVYPPPRETCFYTAHAFRAGKYGRPSLWINGPEYCE